MLPDNEIYALLQRHPEKGLEKLMNVYMGLVYTIVYGRLYGTGTIEDIEECISDVFIDLYNNRGSIDLEKGSIKAYLSVIAKRKAIDVYRKTNKRTSRNLSLDDMDGQRIAAEDSDVESKAADRETRDTLIREIKALGEPDGEIIIRKYYYAQSTKMIAKALRLKVNTVDQKVSRGLRRLKQVLGGAL